MTAPDLRTAAQVLVDDVARRIDALRHPPTRTTVQGSVVLSVLEQLEPLAADVRTALAAEATEPPPSISCALCGHLAAHFPDEPCPVGVDEGTICGCPGVPGSAPNPQGADEPKRWTFDVNYEGGPQPVDYGTGTEWDGSYQWAIYDGPHEIDDVVLAGWAPEDPTPVLTALVAEHNRAAGGGVPDEPGDDLTELRRLHELARTEPVPWKADNALAALNARLWRDLPGLLAEVARLRAAAPVMPTALAADMRRRARAMDDTPATGAASAVMGQVAEWLRSTAEVIEADHRRAAAPASEDDEPSPADQALWDVYAALGFDTDGDPTPAAVVAGMGPEGYRSMVVRVAREFRQEYEAALDEIPAGSPPSTPAPTRDDLDPIAEGTILDAVHMVTGVVELIIEVPEAEYADHLGTAVEVRAR